ncbi:MAG: NCS1 family nucleobase:cation symporter-1 [Negativicutes bacterium]|nr:NCS1 family nucleobase:cation symporter-1 [Negativicutes bacterium]
MSINKEMVELNVDVSDSPLYNKDLAPTTIAQRTWTTYNFAALWIGMAHCVPTYMLASGLIALGMNWKQAIFTVTLGNVIVLIPMLLNAHPGTKYGIPFPVLARASFGTIGANIPAMLRAGVACGWFGINTFIGGSALNNFGAALFPAWKTFGGDISIIGMTLPSFITFMIFWALNIYIIYNGMETVRKFENWAAPLVLVMAGLLLFWIVGEAKGLGPILDDPGKLTTFSSFFPVFIPSLTGMIAFWATLSLNIPDFTRFGKGQKEQIAGQIIGLPTTMTLFSTIGVIITSATLVVYGKAIWDPSELLLKFDNPFILCFSLFGILVATLSVNIAANVVSPANDFANLLPKYISFKTGGLITGLAGIAIMPWKLMSDPSMYIFNWLGVYSGFLGPIAGVMIADYYIVRKKELNLADLYRSEGEYTYSGGFNWSAVLALAAGVGCALVGKFVPAMDWLFNYSWFVGLGVAFAMYLILMRGVPSPAVSKSANKA